MYERPNLEGVVEGPYEARRSSKRVGEWLAVTILVCCAAVVVSATALVIVWTWSAAL